MSLSQKFNPDSGSHSVVLRGPFERARAHDLDWLAAAGERARPAALRRLAAFAARPRKGCIEFAAHQFLDVSSRSFPHSAVLDRRAEGWSAE